MESARIKQSTAVLAALAAAGLLLSGCAGDNSRTEDDKQDRRQSEPKAPTEETPDTPDNPGLTEDPGMSEDPFQEPEDQDVFDIELGDCITDTQNEGEVQSLPTVACSQPHTYEVFHEFDLEGSGSFPGEKGMEKDIVDQCYGKPFEEFVGRPYDNSALDVLYLHPTERSWKQGDRTVSCLVFEGDGTGNKTTGSLEGSNL